MQYSILSLLPVVALVSAQGAPYGLAPAGGSPAGCSGTVSGRYEVQNVQIAKRDLVPRVVDCSNPDALVITFDNGVIHDSHGRIGEIVANRQFQFDGPPAQDGTIYDAGWSMCSNGSLAIGPTTNFYQCLSGKFYNVYDQPVGAECVLINQLLLQCADSTGAGSTVASVATYSSTAAPASSSSVVASSSVVSNTTMTSSMMSSSMAATTTTSVTSASAPVSQSSDGQVQATTPASSSSTALHTGAAAHYAPGAVAAVGAVAAFLL